jgi:hypothetical protein
MDYRYAVETKRADDAWRDRFVYGDAEPYDVEPGLSDNDTYHQIRVVASRAVDPRTERWNGQHDPDNCTRPATAAEIAAWEAEHQGRRRLSKFAFLQLLTPAEYVEMFTPQNDPMIAYGIALFHAAPDPFNIDDPLTESLLAYCVGTGKLTADRMAELLAGMAAQAHG